MKTVLDMTIVLAAAYDVADVINRSVAMDDYLASKRALQKDDKAQKLIAEFRRLKDAYEDVQRFGKYHPDYERIRKEMSACKRKLDLHPSIAAFKRAENHLEEVLYRVAKTIAGAVSDTIKVPSDNPLLSGMGCGSGGCGTGGCACRKEA